MQNISIEKQPDKTNHSSKEIFSATGANPTIPPFTEKALEDHWNGARNHSADYNGWTKEQYAERALDLVRMPTSDNILGYKSANGAIVRYCKITNDFVKGFDTGVATMFKLRGEEKRFNRMMSREGGKQDD
jgi:hypothetical protein